MTSMVFKRDYHQRWQEEINWLLKEIDQQPTTSGYSAEVSIAIAILKSIRASMPTGIDIITVQRITGCDDVDINALYLIMGLVPNLSYRFSLVDGIAKLLPM